MRRALCVCGIVLVGAWFVTPTTGAIGVMRAIVVDLIGVALGLVGVVGGWAWGGYNLVQIVRDAADGSRTVSAVQCLVEENSGDPGFADKVTMRTESGERLEATHYGPSFFDVERP